jgi:O-antigen/teichoic acid export membrane protein
MFSLIIPLTQKYGMVGTASAVLISSFIAEFILLLKLRKEINLRFRVLIKIVALPLVGSLAMAVILYLFKNIIPLSGIFIFMLYIILGVIIYFTFLFVLDRIFGRRFYESFIWIKKNI